MSQKKVQPSISNFLTKKKSPEVEILEGNMAARVEPTENKKKMSGASAFLDLDAGSGNQSEDEVRLTEEAADVKALIEYEKQIFIDAGCEFNVTLNEDATQSSRGKRSRSPVTDQTRFDTLLGLGVPELGAPPKKKQSAAKKPAEKKPRGKVIKIDGLTVEQHRRKMGDSVKARISCDKYTIAARTHTSMECSFELFEAIVIPNCLGTTPSKYSAKSEVIVCRAQTQGIAEMFGATKVKGGNRYSTFTANCMDLIFYPSQKRIDVWWTMDGY